MEKGLGFRAHAGAMWQERPLTLLGSQEPLKTSSSTRFLATEQVMCAYREVQGLQVRRSLLQPDLQYGGLRK